MFAPFCVCFIQNNGLRTKKTHSGSIATKCVKKRFYAIPPLVIPPFACHRIVSQFPDPPFLVIVIYPLFLGFPIFLVFLYLFPFFSKDFGSSAKKKTLAVWRVEGQGGPEETSGCRESKLQFETLIVSNCLNDLRQRRAVRIAGRTYFWSTSSGDSETSKTSKKLPQNAMLLEVAPHRRNPKGDGRKRTGQKMS